MSLNTFYPDKYMLNNYSIGKQLEKELRIRIISQDIEKGTVLSENQIAKEYEVSRSPVREALRTLQIEKLIKLERMGIVVAGVSIKDIEEMYDIRLMIESFVMNRVLEKENELLVNELKKILGMMEVAVKYKDIDEFSLQDIRFHEAIIRSIEHQQITIVWEQLKPVMECLIILSMRYREMTQFDDFERVLQNHALMIEAVETKDEQVISQAFSQNFSDVQNKVEDLWTSPEMLKKVREYVGKK